MKKMLQNFGAFRKIIGGISLGVMLFSLNVLAQVSGIPQDVENLEAVSLDQAIKLTWSASSDDGIIAEYKVYYGTSSVTEPEDRYDAELIVDGEETSFLVSNLLNDVEYYFAITAIDDTGNESNNYSPEASAIPGTEAVSTESPQVISAKHVAPSEILVTMSKPVQVDSATDSFYLTRGAGRDEVTISNIVPNSENVRIFVSGGPLEPGIQYFITATSGVTDLNGTPVSSGITDTIDFEAVSVFKSEEAEDPVIIEELPGESIIEEEDDQLLITPEENEPFDFLDTFLENPDNKVEEISSEELENQLEDGQPQEAAPLSSAPDNQPPQDARNLMADTSTAQAQGLVTVSWAKAIDTDGDITDQILYTRVGLGPWDNGYSIGKDVTSTEIEVQTNQNYQVRIVTVDTSGNESFGTDFTFSTSLSQSGSGGMFVFVGGALLLGMFLLFGRRQTA